jgi:hypothetical protein
MNITQISTSYNWVDNRQVVTERKIETFDKGNSVTTVYQRSYEIFLYDSMATRERNDVKGQNIDVNV